MAPNDGPLRVALIASSFAPHVGGVETHVDRVAAELSASGHEVEVWTVDRGMRPDAAPPAVVRYLPTPLPAQSARGALRMLWAIPRAWRAWRRAHRRFAPDILAVQCFGPNGLYALALHRRFKTPLVVSSHGETLGDDGGVYARSALLRRGLRSSLALAAAVTAPSTYVLDDLRGRFGLEGGTIVPNGVDLSLGVEDPGSPRLPLVVAVGRLGRMKGFDLLITAMAQPGFESVRLEIIGDGPERARLQRQIDAAGLGERMLLTGAADAEGVARRIAAASVLVVPSRSESFGIVALEAWRGGAALVMTSRGGASDFVRDGEDGLLVDPEDTDALATAIRSLIEDEGRRRRFAEAGSRRVPEFTWGRVASAYERLFARVRDEARGRSR
ncbi:glycosyltransferase family 4 protein [Microbacterium hydrocarbonoxydans]|uniref:glycosyltransferase family 4 protein n=1 Tax=Microbacterium hydrocarbonoxydans TaxID=273678 RepID=UPI0013DB7AA1|nr:glycosyltransferase family 4 protein [Microbacterium hydrocarbonoxydans]